MRASVVATAFRPRQLPTQQRRWRQSHRWQRRGRQAGGFCVVAVLAVTHDCFVCSFLPCSLAGVPAWHCVLSCTSKRASAPMWSCELPFGVAGSRGVKRKRSQQDARVDFNVLKARLQSACGQRCGLRCRAQFQTPEVWHRLQEWRQNFAVLHKVDQDRLVPCLAICCVLRSRRTP